MSDYVVISQEHDTDSGLYRLTYGVVNHAASDNGNTVYEETRDVVWADDDPQWEGKTDSEIAQAQRNIISEALSTQVRQTPSDERSNIRDLGGSGELL